MKKYVLKSIFTLIVITAFLGCSSDSNSTPPCTPIVCQNGGISRADCGCDCPLGYSGTNCSTQITPISITITKIRVTMFPNSDGTAFWDTFPDSYADISVLMGRANGTASPDVLWTASTYFSNALSNGTNYDFIPTTPIVLTQVNTPHFLELYDYDGADPIPNADDTMGVIAFYPYSSTNDFPTTLQVRDDSIPLRFELTLSYQF